MKLSLITPQAKQAIPQQTQPPKNKKTKQKYQIAQDNTEHISFKQQFWPEEESFCIASWKSAVVTTKAIFDKHKHPPCFGMLLGQACPLSVIILHGISMA